MKTTSEMTDRELLEYLAGEVRNINLSIENEIKPDIHSLAEGHTAILDKLDSLSAVSRVEALETDVALLKQVIRSLSQDLAELKRAQ